MSNPVSHAFFVGRATATALTEKLEDALTDFLSEVAKEVAKFDAKQRQNLREFVQVVQTKVDQEQSNFSGANSHGDIQEVIDNLRAEIAHLRTELQKYRNSQTHNP